MPKPATNQSPYTTQAMAVHRNRWVMGAAALPFLICLFSIIAGFAIAPPLFILMIHGLALGTVSSLYAWTRNPWPRLSTETVRVDGQCLAIGDRSYPRDEIVSGLLVPDKGQVTVQLKRKGLRPTIDVRVADEAQGQALLQALGFAVTQTVGSFRTMSRVHSSIPRSVLSVLGTMAATMGLSAALGALIHPFAAMGGMLLGLIALGVLLLAPTRVDVGADGVLLRWLGRERFIAHADIQGTEAKVTGWGKNRRAVVNLTLRSGERVVIPTGTAAFDSGRAKGLDARIRTAQQAWAGGVSVHAEALLRRGERSHGDWVRALQDPHAAASLRSAPVPAERLWRIVEDPATSTLDRAAAAVALKPELDPTGRARLEKAAAVTAAPRLRIALDAVAHDADHEALAEALAELEAEQATQQQSQA